MALLDSIKSIVRTVAPILGTALGGSLGGAAASTIANAICGKPEATEKEIYASLQSPESLLKLKEAENAFVIKLKELGIDEMKLEAMDRDSARLREAEMAKSGNRDYTTSILAVCLTFGFFGMLITLMFFGSHIPQTILSVIEILLGALATAFISIINYYFGSSKSSGEKNKMIAEMTYK